MKKIWPRFQTTGYCCVEHSRDSFELCRLRALKEIDYFLSLANQMPGITLGRGAGDFFGV